MGRGGSGPRGQKGRVHQERDSWVMWGCVGHCEDTVLNKGISPIHALDHSGCSLEIDAGGAEHKPLPSVAPSSSPSLVCLERSVPWVSTT